MSTVIFNSPLYTYLTMRWLELLLSIISIAITFLSYFKGLIGLEPTITIICFIILTTLTITILLRLNQFDKILKLFKSIVDNLLTCIPKLQSQLGSKNPDSPVTWKELENLINSFTIPFLTEIGKEHLQYTSKIFIIV